MATLAEKIGAVLTLEPDATATLSIRGVKVDVSTSELAAIADALGGRVARPKPRHSNSCAAVLLALQHGPMTAAQIGESTGTDGHTAFGRAEMLRRQGRVVKLSKAETGSPRVLYALAPKAAE